LGGKYRKSEGDRQGGVAEGGLFSWNRKEEVGLARKSGRIGGKGKKTLEVRPGGLFD